MHVLRDKKLWKAVGLAVGFYALVPMGAIGVNVGGSSFWSAFLWPTMSPLFIAIPLAFAAIATGCVLRPRHPQRLAAWIGGLGALLCIGLPHLIPWPLGRTYASQALGFIALTSGYFSSPLAVGCWIAADYWRCESSTSFWRGPSGAIVRGGLAAGLLAVAIAVPMGDWLHHSVLSPRFAPLGSILSVLSHFSSLPLLAVVTAILARWRPSPVLGAFAGMGLALGVTGVIVLPTVAPLLSPGLHAAGYLHSFDRYHTLAGWLRALYRVLINAAMAALAGSFAGRWEPDPLPDE